ncbi:MAG: hypothetical protein KJN63_11735 [Acidimicrobiia bacterium]|nr:hypothetical protein [Acidimicrobiia bacterium]
MTTQHPGYWNSPWPVECGGNRRQKHAAGQLDARTSAPIVATRTNMRWNVMVINREPDQWYLAGTIAAFEGEPPFGWVQRIDPDTLSPIADSGELLCGDHVWCGAIAAHANGSLYNVNGSYLHRLSADCQIESEARLPVDQAHNGLLILADGTVVTKDLRLENDRPSTITRLDPDTLQPVHAPLELPEASMGRIAADLTPDGELIYVPGSRHVFRLRVELDGLVLDDDWQPQYRTDDVQGMAWDSCLSGGNAWIMDNGDIEAVRTIFAQHPNGRLTSRGQGRLSWQHHAPWPGPQRLIKVSLDSGDVAAAAPFDSAGGGIIAPPIHLAELGLVVCWDSINGGMAGLDDATLEIVWRNQIRPTMQPLLYAESNELVINDFRAHHDELVVLDARTGALLSRVNTGSRLANGMFLSPGPDRSVFYCSTLAVVRITWQ